MRALSEGCEVQPSVVHPALERGREGHERRLHVVQRPLHQTVVVLRSKYNTVDAR